jgi:predicted exporter
VITFLRGIHDPEAIREALTGIEGAHYLDQGELLREIFAGYRRSTLRAVVLGSALIFGMLLLRYRRLKSAFLAFTPSVLVAFATLGLLGIAGVAVNLLCLVSLLLVVGMGADYGVFALECASDPGRMAPTLVGMLASWLTTLLAFGMLALSEHPALRSIGLTTGIGISLAFLASPAVLVLASKRAGR